MLLYVHPFAEEMNKTRRMVGLQARYLASAGYSVLQIDLRGCGDSSGDFGDCTWNQWLEDVVSASHWLRQQASAPLWLWGLRSGCLLSLSAAAIIGANCNFLFWQPVALGKTALQQFLRLGLAGSLFDNAEKGIVGTFREALARGETVDVAGYRLGAALAAGLESASLTPPTGICRVEWLEVSSRSEAQLSPLATTLLQQWKESGHWVHGRVVQGPPFWQTSEIEEAPALLDATLLALESDAAL